MSVAQPATDAHVPRDDPEERRALRRAAWLVFAVALVARLIALRYATLDSGDSVSRVLLGWLWSEQPFYISSGGWGPLHFYLIGAAMSIWADPVWTPAALHILCGCLTAFIVCKLAFELFGSVRAALLTGFAAAVYPMAVLGSLEAHSEVVFGLFLAGGLLFLVRAWRPSGALRDAVLAGVCITLASMLRYEAWLLLPFLALPLLFRWRKVFAFLVPALLHPLVWMTGNALERGNPFYSFAWSSNFEREVMGQKTTAGLALALQQIWTFVMTTVHGLSLPLTLLVGLGVAWCALRRRVEMFWLIPPLGLFALLMIAGARGSLWVKPAYTISFGLMLIPFIAYAFSAAHVERWPRGRFVGAAIVLLAAIGITTIEPLWRAIPHGGFFLSRAAGQFQESGETDAVLALLNDGRELGEQALVSDFIGWQSTAYLIEHAKAHPANLCVPNGAPIPVDIAAVQAFLRTHPRGFLVAHEGGKLTALLERGPGDSGSLAGVPLKLRSSGALQWPGTVDAPDVRAGKLEVLRFEVTGEPVTPANEPPGCSMGCPVSFCSA
jgi:hypothetical protein